MAQQPKEFKIFGKSLPVDSNPSQRTSSPLIFTAPAISPPVSPIPALPSPSHQTTTNTSTVQSKPLFAPEISVQSFAIGSSPIRASPPSSPSSSCTSISSPMPSSPYCDEPTEEYLGRGENDSVSMDEREALQANIARLMDEMQVQKAQHERQLISCRDFLASVHTRTLEIRHKVSIEAYNSAATKLHELSDDLVLFNANLVDLVGRPDATITSTHYNKKRKVLDSDESMSEEPGKGNTKASDGKNFNMKLRLRTNTHAYLSPTKLQELNDSYEIPTHPRRHTLAEEGASEDENGDESYMPNKKEPNTQDDAATLASVARGKQIGETFKKSGTKLQLPHFSVPPVCEQAANKVYLSFKSTVQAFGEAKRASAENDTEREVATLFIQFLPFIGSSVSYKGAFAHPDSLYKYFSATVKVLSALKHMYPDDIPLFVQSWLNYKIFPYCPTLSPVSLLVRKHIYGLELLTRSSKSKQKVEQQSALFAYFAEASSENVIKEPSVAL